MFIDSHKATLESIELTSLTSGNKGCLDLSDYPRLKSFTACAWALGTTTAEELVARLPVASLRSFAWCFDRVGQWREGLRDFGDDQEQWLRRFISHALNRGFMLCHVHIKFTPDYWNPYKRQPDELPAVYPYDRMDQLAAEFKSREVEVTYEEPRISKEQFLIMKRAAESST